jgi:hypothetical protein
MLGATSGQELVGTSLSATMHPDSRRSASERMRGYAPGASIQLTVEERLIRLDGTAFDAEIQGTWIRHGHSWYE